MRGPSINIPKERDMGLNSNSIVNLSKHEGLKRKKISKTDKALNPSPEGTKKTRHFVFETLDLEKH